MLKGNEIITLSGDEAIDVIKIIDCFVVSLNNMAHYYFNQKDVPKEKLLELEKEIGNFVIKNKIGNDFAKARGVLSGKFDSTLGDDDMDDIERETEKTKYWEKPGD